MQSLLCPAGYTYSTVSDIHSMLVGILLVSPLRLKIKKSRSKFFGPYPADNIGERYAINLGVILVL